MARRELTRRLQALAIVTLSAVGILAVGSGLASTGSGTPFRSPTAPRVARASVPKPRIVWDPIPFGAQRKAEMARYVARHYGSFMRPTWKLINPKVIVIHFSDSSTFSSVFNTFASDTPDSELGELPGTCAHFVVDTDGTIHQLVSVNTMCRHTVGLNWTSIGIEHVGFSDQQILGNRRQFSASLRLVHWLRCRLHITAGNVIGHNESLLSPYHREDVASLRTQTHDDWSRPDMKIYRTRLKALGRCSWQRR